MMQMALIAVTRIEDDIQGEGDFATKTDGTG